MKPTTLAAMAALAMGTLAAGAPSPGRAQVPDTTPVLPPPSRTVSIEDLVKASRRAAARSDSSYASPALRGLLERAEAASARVPADLDGYTAKVETELSMLDTEPDGREEALQVEQVASRLLWRAGLEPVQELVGYRAQTLGFAPSTLSFFEIPWLVPVLYGDRLDLVRTDRPESRAGRTVTVRAVHPFAADRARFYTFSGGDTVDVIRLPDRTIPLVRIHVTPRGQPDRNTRLFQGDVDLDANRLQIVRMRGRLLRGGSPGGGLLGAVVSGALYVQFENAEYDGKYWLPHYQRIEVQATSPLTDQRLAFRVVSRFAAVRPNAAALTSLAAAGDTLPGGTLVTSDLGRLSEYGGWSHPLGQMTAAASARDFDDVAPTAVVVAREPGVRFGARYLSSLVRVNEVEGLFTGGGFIANAGKDASGPVLRVHAGYGWGEGQVRGGAELSGWIGGWELGVRAARELSPTNDFVANAVLEPDVPPLIAGQSWDFVDRQLAGVIARQPRGSGTSVRLELARARDRDLVWSQAADTVGAGPAVGVTGTAVDRPMAEGVFWLARAAIEHDAGAGALSLRPGLGWWLRWEGATGDLDWQRIVLGTGGHTTRGRFAVSGRFDAGLVASSDPPPQALFELGGASGLSGYDPKSFTGDLAAVLRGMTMYTLPLLERPVRIGSLWFPGPAPAPSVGIDAGWTYVTADGRRLLERNGWTTSDGVRADLDLRMRFFGGGVSIGAARPLGEPGPWRFVASLAVEY